MSQSDRIISKLENHVSIIKYLKDNYPSILKEWSNGAINATTTDDTKAVFGQEVPNHDT